MKTAEQISSEIIDKYGLTIDMSIHIEDAIKQARNHIFKEFINHLNKYEGFEEIRFDFMLNDFQQLGEIEIDLLFSDK